MRALLAILAAVWTVALASPSWAHAAEQPLEIEIQVLQDEGEDAFYFYDGYDLYNLFVREAFWEPFGEEGLVFRFTLYGGFGPQRVADALHVEIGLTAPAGEQILRLTTQDDETWEGDLRVIYQDIQPDSAPFVGVTAKLQAFASLEQLGLREGDTIEAIWMKSYAGDDLVDVAPGGYFVPGSGGRAEIPAESLRLVDAITLEGPNGYVTVEPQPGTGHIRVVVVNPLSTGQHVHLHWPPTPGWNLSLRPPIEASIDFEESAEFLLNVSADSSALQPQELHLLTDLGGKEILFLGVNGTEVLVGQDASALEVAPPQPPRDTPMPVAGLLVALGAAAWRRTKR